jgi:hypothetical protein
MVQRVPPDQWNARPHPYQGAASFLEIANEPSITPLSLRVFFQSSHQNVPDFHISASQVDDLSAYILSLKRKQELTMPRLRSDQRQPVLW